MANSLEDRTPEEREAIAGILLLSQGGAQETQLQPSILPSTPAVVPLATSNRPSPEAQPMAPVPSAVPFLPQLIPGQERTAGSLLPLIKAMYQPCIKPETEETNFIRRAILWNELTDQHLLSVAETLFIMGANANVKDAIWYLEESDWVAEIAAQYYILDLIDRTDHPLTHTDAVIPKKKDKDEDDDEDENEDEDEDEDGSQFAKKNWTSKNPDVDRNMAFPGAKFDSSMLRIEIMQNKLKKFRFEKPAHLDMNSPSIEHVKLLNIWRRKIFRKELGPEIMQRKSGRACSSLEITWLKNRFAETDYLEGPGYASITSDFNDNFAGAYLPGAANACDTRSASMISGAVNKHVTGEFKKDANGSERPVVQARRVTIIERRKERQEATEDMLADLEGGDDEKEEVGDPNQEDGEDEEEGADSLAEAMDE